MRHRANAEPRASRLCRSVARSNWSICLPGDSLLTLGAGLSHDRAQPSTFSMLSQRSVADPPSCDDEVRGPAEATVAFGPRLDGLLQCATVCSCLPLRSRAPASASSALFDFRSSSRTRLTAAGHGAFVRRSSFFCCFGRSPTFGGRNVPCPLGRSSLAGRFGVIRCHRCVM